MAKLSLNPWCGSSVAHFWFAPSPSCTSMAEVIRIKRRGAFCNSIPALCNKKTKDAADPSKMGTSSAVMSTYRLSIPKPAQADIRCSTVCTLASPCDKVEAKRVSVTAFAETAISTTWGKSMRRNTIPVSGAAGRKVISTRWPLCKPTPTARVRDLRVLCWSILRL